MASTALRNQPDYVVPTYKQDYAGWAFHQAMLLRSGQLHLLDRAWIAEELDSLGGGEYNALESVLVRVLQHMLEWDHQPERRSPSWWLSIANHRDMAERQLRENPGLNSRIEEAVGGAFRYARREAAAETGLPLKNFPPLCPYSWDEIRNRPFDLPDDA